MRIDFAAVSYTHLDVYKRQVPDIAAGVLKKRDGILAVGILGTCLLYTSRCV